MAVQVHGSNECVLVGLFEIPSGIMSYELEFITVD